MLARLRNWQKNRVAAAGRNDGFAYASNELAADPEASARLLIESQDSFGEHGWWPFNEGICAAVEQHHREKQK